MRTRFGLVMIVLVSLVLVACGGGDGEEEATVAPTDPPAATEAPTERADATAAVVATPAVSPAGLATPASLATRPELVASPAASPVFAATPVATPVASPVVAMAGTPAVVVPMADAATPEASPAARVALSGLVTLPGNLNEAYVLSDEGCVGLGVDADMRVGRQVVVRDETGTIIGVTALETSDVTDACAWSFTVEVPEATFYAVSVPMKMEMVFTHDEVARNGGEIAIPVR